MVEENTQYKTNEGKPLWLETIEFLKNVSPLPPLQKHEGLCKAAEAHAEDLSKKNTISHTGSDSSGPLERVSRFCKRSSGKTGENIGTDFKLKDRNIAENTVLGLVIDDGVKGRGHRHSIFDPDFAFYGSSTK